MKLKLSFLLLVFASGAIAAQERITGAVISGDDGMPLAGASVVVAGTTTGTTTDFDGNYVLENVASNATLSFSYIGFVGVQIPLNGSTSLNVTLQTDAQQLDEVILTGYTAQRKVDMTGAIEVIETEAIEAQSLSSGNPMQALQGRVAGLFVEKSGDPSGAASRILIRGVNTLGDNNPLYVIDGVPTTRPEIFASLNSSSIESIQVLKDASASSIYGARASNGVIIVTTKSDYKSLKGKKFNVTMNSNFSILDESKMRINMLNARERGEILWRASVNDGADPNDGFGDIYQFDWNGDFNTPILNGVTVQPFVGGDPNVPSGDTDWQDVVYETGYVFNNEVSISGGDENGFVSANFGHLRNTGILKETGYERFTGELNASYNLFDNKVKVGVNSRFSTSDQTRAASDVGGAPVPFLALTLAPTIPVFTSTGEFAGPLGAGLSDRNNPLLMQVLNKDDNEQLTNLFGSIYLEYNILPNLKFRTSAGLDYSDFKDRNVEKRVNNGFVNRTVNSLTIENNNFRSRILTSTLNYNFEMGNNKFDVLLGYETVDNKFDNTISRAEGFALENDSFFVLSAATGNRTNSGTETSSRLISQFGKIGYTYADKYLATFTLRRDGSSRFGDENRFGYFPAASVGWRLNSEDFLKEVNSLSNLKLRAGWGKVGNQSISDLAQFALFETRAGTRRSQFTGDFFDQFFNIGTSFDLNGNNSGNLPSGFAQVQAANPDLKWETTEEYNVGLDFGFLKNSFTGSFDYFFRETSDILITPPIASAVGEGQLRVLNGATTETTGWELSLGYAKTLANGFSFGITTNFSSFDDEITELPEEVRAGFPGTANNSILGQSQFAVFGFRTDGFFQSQEDVDNHADQVAARPGGIKFVDLNGDGIINPDDRDFIGKTVPDLEYGIRIDLAYKNFDLSAFGSGVAGREGIDNSIFFTNFVPGRENGTPALFGGWTPQNTNAKIPALSLVNNNIEVSDYILRNNSYFKLRSLALGYSLPDAIINKWAGMQKMRIYFQAENLFWVTDNEFVGNDPERTNLNTIPVPQTFSFGLNVNF